MTKELIWPYIQASNPLRQSLELIVPNFFFFKSLDFNGVTLACNRHEVTGIKAFYPSEETNLISSTFSLQI